MVSTHLDDLDIDEVSQGSPSWQLILTLNRKLNTSPSSIDDKEVLKKLLVNPPIKKIDLHFPLGTSPTIPNLSPQSTNKPQVSKSPPATSRV